MQSSQSNPINASFNYSANAGQSSTNPFLLVIETRDPTPQDFNYPVRQFWVNTVLKNMWILLGFSNKTGQSLANWLLLTTGGAPSVEQFFTTNDGNTELPAGTPPTITFTGANGISVIEGANDNTINFQLPSSSPGQVLTGIGTNTPIFSTTVAGDGFFTFTTETTNAFKNVIITTQDTTHPGNQVALTITGGGTGSGAEYMTINKGGAVRSWAYGMQGTTGVDLVIHTVEGDNVTPNTGLEYWRMTVNGYRTMPFQCSFLYSLATTVPNATGNGSTYTLGTNALTKKFDQNSNAGTNGIFTAPVNGVYDLRSMITVSSTTIATSFIISIVVSGVQANTFQETFSRAALSANQSLMISAITLMNAGDTAVVTIIANGEAGNTDSILGGTTLVTYFCGALIC
jgi:hypothetical protein